MLRHTTRKILNGISIFTLLAFLMAGVTSCEETTTTIGSVIASGEVEITVDSINFDLMAKPVAVETYDSKTGNLMVGKIQVEQYGRLNCSFVSRLMCTPTLGVPDSILRVLPERIDSCKLLLSASREGITGDSLAPQRLAVYLLDKQLPSSINNSFNPEGYYNPSTPLASKSYTVSGIAESDSAFYNNPYVDLTVDLPLEFGVQIVEKYLSQPDIFQWPQTMAENYIPGIYVESTFGNGCIANIDVAYIGIYYHTLKETTEEIDDETVTRIEHVGNVIYPFSITPEVLSSNNISYTPAENIVSQNEMGDGRVVITTPGGYMAQFSFPAQELIDRYLSEYAHLSTVNELFLYIPAEEFDKASGIGVAPNLLLIKTSEYQDFFAKNKIPDNLTSFTGVYDAENSRYYFSSMRSYFLELLAKDTITPEDIDFTLVPVEIETESVSSYYSDITTYVTKCVPYTSRPTMTLLKSDEARVAFSFSTQMID